ncbi:hypothetical protein HHK36_013927 [Tetracentron sinense]|uniref:C2 NT-type domain-containing protein n=1 Tax=Tetracentron sinense TaxID=13715 RepID=A0A834Z8Z6_TETSI|nr:hypothetical protein HHK36_013927 [Tetracentron sinense]
MVVINMMKWSPWPPVPPARKFQVKVRLMKLEGFDGYEEEEEEEGEKKVVVVEMKWKDSKMGLVKSGRTSKRQRISSGERIVRRGETIEFDDEFESVCSFSILQKDNSFNPLDVSFDLLYGPSTKPRNKFTVMGRVSLNIADLASEMEPRLERKLPIGLQVGDVASEANLFVSISLVEIRSSQDSAGVAQDTVVVGKEDGFLRKVMDLTSYVSMTKKKKKKKKKKKSQDQNDREEVRDEGALNMFSGDTDESGTFDPESSPDNESDPTQQESWATIDKSEIINDIEASLVTQLSSETQLLDSVPKTGFLSWKRKRLNFRYVMRKEEPFIKKTNGDKGDSDTDIDLQRVSSSPIESVTSKYKPEEVVEKTTSQLDFREEWEAKELISRDGQAKLKANVFFASIDQCSEKADGESACTALVAVIADWFQSNRDAIPTRSQFDSLITEGSSEWRKLCDNEAYIQCFPDKHFDIETVLQADLRPLSVVPEKSFIGFFCPESFESLKGAMSFDGIWDEISSNMGDREPRVYIVSWNDHFFVLKVEDDAYYIIDTLGERLFEGCNQAYILKFDDSALMYRLPEKAEDGRKEIGGVETEECGKSNDSGDKKREESEELICSGKDCCREFIKRFLAAILLKELEVEEKKGTLVGKTLSLHQRLQIEFHFTSASSSSSSDGRGGWLSEA